MIPSMINLAEHNTCPIRLALADDQALIRSGLRRLLQDMGFDIGIEVTDGETLVSTLTADASAASDNDSTEAKKVDVIVSDIRMPGMDGISALTALRAAGVATPCLFLTTFEDHDLLLRAVQAGAQGFLLKDAAPEDLRDAITRVANGESLLQPVAFDSVRERYRYHDQSAPSDTFNDKEIAILRLMAGGYSNKEIARTLFLAEGTVKNYVSEILDKLDTRDRTRAVLKAITLRII